MTKDLVIGLMAGSMGAVFLMLALAVWLMDRKRNR
jgi:hypothetical protein